MKKLIPITILLALLLSGCGPNLPYKVWEDFDQMKKSLGDHFLYPAYIPDGLDDFTLISEYNSLSLKARAKVPYYGYSGYAYTDGTYPSFYIFATDPSLDKTDNNSTSSSYNKEIIDSWIEKINETEVSITTIYAGKRVTRVEFEIDGISYGIGYECARDSDKDTDPEQLKELLKVAESIIEQTEEDE